MICTVGEMAKRMGIAPSTLRYYDKEGLLPFVERSGGGIRVFKDEDWKWLSIIECLKQAGVAVKDIKTFIDWCMEGDSTIDQRLELMERQRTAVMRQMEQMQKTLSLLDYKCWYYQTAKEAGTCKIHNTMKEEDIPEELRSAWRASR